MEKVRKRFTEEMVVSVESLQHFNYYAELCEQMTIDGVYCQYKNAPHHHYCFLHRGSGSYVDGFSSDLQNELQCGSEMTRVCVFFGTAQHSLESAH